MKQYDRFDLEEDIMGVWNTENDLDTILYRILDSSDGPCSEDEIANMILGLKEIHKSRCLKLWDTFENMIKTERIQNNDSYNYKNLEIDATAPSRTE